jgi:tripartite motif-containing protein 56
MFIYALSVIYVCVHCLGKYVERLRRAEKKIEIFPCPTCRSEFTLKSNQDVAELPSSYFIKNMLEIMAIQQKAKTSTACSRCQDPAINHCPSCEIFMCKKCSDLHDSWPTHKNHNTLSVQELSNPKSQVKMRSKLYCTKHKDEVLKYYCETCKELSCIDCVVLNHQKPNHSCVAVSELANNQRETLQSSCTTLDEKLAEGKEVLNNICEVMKSLEPNSKTAKDQIEEQKENILKIVAKKLNDRAKKMNNDVDKLYGELHSELSEQHDEMKDYLDKVQASVSLPKNLLKRGSIEEIISSQKLIDEKIEKLSNQKPENLAAVNDGSIQYVPDDIGNINVDEIIDKLGHVEGMCNLRYISVSTLQRFRFDFRSIPLTHNQLIRCV